MSILPLVLLTALISALCVGFVSESPSPTLAVSPSYLAAQEEHDPHEGQPERCTNARTEKGRPHFCECKKDAEAVIPKTRNARCIATKTIVTVSTRGETRDSKIPGAPWEPRLVVVGRCITLSLSGSAGTGRVFDKTILTVPTQAT